MGQEILPFEFLSIHSDNLKAQLLQIKKCLDHDSCNVPYSKSDEIIGALKEKIGILIKKQINGVEHSFILHNINYDIVIDPSSYAH